MEEEETLLEKNEEKSSDSFFKNLSCITANQALEKAASCGLSANMILYLENEYHLGLVAGSNIVNLWSAATSFLPVFGAFLADSHVGRYSMIAFGCIVGLLGMILLWSTTIIPQARPPSCYNSTTTCDSSTNLQVFFLCFALGLVSIGVGGIRSASMAFGADQFVKEKRLAALESYFGWYYASASVAIVISLTFVVYIQEHMGWQVGFGIPVVLMLLGTLLFFSGSSSYIRSENKSSLIAGLSKVIVASYSNRHFRLAPQNNNVYHCKHESALVIPSEKLRFLNKACVVDPKRHATLEQDTLDSWSLCTVDQVEELKAILKVIPLWSTGVLMHITLSQPSMVIVQAITMDRHITTSFEIPAASLGVFFVVAAISSVVLYERIIVPLTSGLMGTPFHLTSKVKMGIGIFFSIIATVGFAFVEHIRRGIAIKQGFADNQEGVVNMSALWLIIPLFFSGVGDAMNSVGQYEFYYSEFPKSMSSIASSLRELSTSVGSLVGACIINIIDNVTSSKGKTSWISSNINQGHYDYYYLVISGLCVVNMLYYLLCSWAYGPCEFVAVKASQKDDRER